MTVVQPVVAAANISANAGYDIVLLAHVLTALIGLGAVMVAGGSALALSRPGPPTEYLERYYRPGINWAGRVLFLVPVLGVVLIAMSQGQWSFSDSWVGIGLVLWALVALVAEMVLWPAERKLQAAVGDRSPEGDQEGDLRPACLRVAAVAAVLAVLLVVAMVVMVAKP
jgi:hypothetical protein